MSPEWPPLVVFLLVLPPALGHLYHFVLVTNVASGLGFREPAMDRARNVFLAALIASAAFLLWQHVQNPWWNWSWPLKGYALLCVVSGVVIGPLNSAVIQARRRPAGIAGSSVTLDLGGRHGLDALIGEGHGSWLLRLPRNESFRLQLREWSVTIPDLPEPLDGLKILQISDLHIARCFQRRFFEAVIEACLDWDADLVCMTGDLIEDDETIDWIEPLLSPLRARLGKFAILGNHDNEHQPRKTAAELARADFTLLEGRWTTRDVQGTVLAIGGTSYPWGPDIAASDLPAAEFRILMSHSPDQFYKAERWGADLMLAGHNHGGQIRLPIAGPIFMPSRYSRRFDRGYFRKRKTLMYVNEGIGGKHPVRYGCPPEVSLLSLHRGIPRQRGETKGALTPHAPAVERNWING